MHVFVSWLIVLQGDVGSAAAGPSSSGATSSGSAFHESLPPPMRPDEDMKMFRHASMTPASFFPQRHVYMCCGRPMVVPCWMLSLLGTPPTILITPPSVIKRFYDPSKIGVIEFAPSACDLSQELPVFLVFRAQATSRAYRLTPTGPTEPMEHPADPTGHQGFSSPVDTPRAQVLVMSHELSNEREMSSYFAKKFSPAPPVCVLGRSYKATPACKPDETLFDNWQEHSRTHPHPRGTEASWEKEVGEMHRPWRGGPGRAWRAEPGGPALAEWVSRLWQ